MLCSWLQAALMAATSLHLQAYWEEQAAAVKAACSLSSFYGEVWAPLPAQRWLHNIERSTWPVNRPPEQRI